jgi:hypothetical protein
MAKWLSAEPADDATFPPASQGRVESTCQHCGQPIHLSYVDLHPRLDEVALLTDPEYVYPGPFPWKHNGTDGAACVVALPEAMSRVLDKMQENGDFTLGSRVGGPTGLKNQAGIAVFRPIPERHRDRQAGDGKDDVAGAPTDDEL